MMGPCVVWTVILFIIGNGDTFFLLIFLTVITGADWGGEGVLTFGVVLTAGGFGVTGRDEDEEEETVFLLVTDDELVDDEDGADEVDSTTLGTVVGTTVDETLCTVDVGNTSLLALERVEYFLRLEVARYDWSYGTSDEETEWRGDESDEKESENGDDADDDDDDEDDRDDDGISLCTVL